MQNILNYTPEGTPFGVALRKLGKAAASNVILGLFMQKGHGRYKRLHYTLDMAEFRLIAEALEISDNPSEAFGLTNDIRFPLTREEYADFVPVPHCFHDSIIAWAKRL